MRCPGGSVRTACNSVPFSVTVRVNVVEAEAYVESAACVAVTVAEPMPTGVTVLPEIVATPVLLIE